LREDMERTLSLLGCNSVERLDPTYLDIPQKWTRPSRSDPSSVRWSRKTVRSRRRTIYYR